MKGRRRRGGAPLKADPNLTPLLDIVLQLITFFMMLVHFATRIEGADAAVRLPVVPAALPAQGLAFDRLVVNVDREGYLLDGRRRLGPVAAEAWWAEQARRTRAGLRLLGRASGPEWPTTVLFRSDREARLGVVRRVLETAQKHGFGRFSLIVERRGEM